MVTVYKLNGISVFRRYSHSKKEFEFRLFEDDPHGYLMRFSESHKTGHMLDNVWKHIQHLVSEKDLKTIHTEDIK